MSRGTVLAAAKGRFARDGFEKTTLRAIAEDAGVDASMVLYLFGSKEALFRESLRLILDPDLLVGALSGSGGDIGTRMVRTYLSIWEAPDSAHSVRTMLASATSNPDAREAFRSFIQEYLLAAVAGELGGDGHARLRATLAAGSLVGTAMLRYLMEIPPLSELDTEEVVRLVAPTITRYLTAPADELGLPD